MPTLSTNLPSISKSVHLTSSDRDAWVNTAAGFKNRHSGSKQDGDCMICEVQSLAPLQSTAIAFFKICGTSGTGGIQTLPPDAAMCGMPSELTLRETKPFGTINEKLISVPASRLSLQT